MTLNSSLSAGISATLYGAAGLAVPQLSVAVSSSIPLGSGTGVNQADKLYSATRTLAASASEDLDLAGVLVDAFGGTITLARVKALMIRAAAGNTNNVVVGGASSNGFISWVGGATHTVTVRPGGVLFLAAPDAVAYAVTAATADLLHVANSGGTTGVTYDVVIIGASA